VVVRARYVPNRQFLAIPFRSKLRPLLRHLTIGDRPRLYYGSPKLRPQPQTRLVNFTANGFQHGVYRAKPCFLGIFETFFLRSLRFPQRRSVCARNDRGQCATDADA
jgi:hypothetical protein